MSVMSLIESIKGTFHEGNARLDLPAEEVSTPAESAAKPDLEPGETAKKDGKRKREEGNEGEGKGEAGPAMKKCVVGYSESEANRARDHIVRFHEQRGWTNKEQTS